LARIGRRVTGAIDQPHLTPWSTAFRIPTDHGIAWSKATGPGPAYEGPLLAAMAAHRVEHVLYPIAADHDRAWLLFPDGGATLRSLGSDGSGDHDLPAWEHVVRSYAGLQRAAEAWAPGLAALGVPDTRPERLTGILAGLLDDDGIWKRADMAGTRADLRARLPMVEAAATDLASSGIPPSIDHADLHGRNVLVAPDGDRIFDWGDATIAHPFQTMATTLTSIVRRTGRSMADPSIVRLLDAYLEAWTDRRSRSELTDIAERVMRLAPIAKATAWERALRDLEPDAMGGFERATAETLAVLVGSPDRGATPLR
jgi:hypothetical protein